MNSNASLSRGAQSTSFHNRPVLGVLAVEGGSGVVSYGIFNAENNGPLRVANMKFYSSIEELLTDVETSSPDGSQTAPVELCGDIPAMIDDATGKVRVLNQSELFALHRKSTAPIPQVALPADP